jgi:hypothetical protein
MTKALKKRFTNDLQKLIGKECWGIAEGKGTGSIIDFKFGEKIPLETPIDNEFLSVDCQNYEPEFNLFVKCVWRVDSPLKVLCGASTEHKFVRRVMNRIIGQNVVKVELSEPALDLQVTFSNDLKLTIFCDQTNVADKWDNYDYFTPDIIYAVGHKSKLETEEYEQ